MIAAETVLLLSFAVVLYRFFHGPTQWDRLLAYNSASNRVIIILAIVAILTKQDIYLDVAIVYAALSFLGLVILARFTERGEGYR